MNKALTKEQLLIVNCGVHGWYPRGTQRLIESCEKEGLPIHAYKGIYPSTSPSHKEVPYAFKFYALLSAKVHRPDHKWYIWVDSSFWLNDINSLIQTLQAVEDDNPNGKVIFQKNGFDIACQWTDKMARITGTTHEELEGQAGIAGGFIAVKADYLMEWMQYFGNLIKDRVWTLEEVESTWHGYKYYRAEQAMLSHWAWMDGKKAESERVAVVVEDLTFFNVDLNLAGDFPFLACGL